MSTSVADIAAALPDYEIGEELGRGGFGVVRAGRHRILGREVAIKELSPGLSADPRVRHRFAAEARALAAMSHPHIVPVFDYTERDGLCLLVMEKLTGGSVWDRFKGAGLSTETAAAVVMATCAGLDYAHRRQVLHRDVKPENLLVSPDGTLKLTDFGIAKVIGGDETLATRRGEILGTPAYVAPEQAQGHPLGPAADVYATGVLLYELLSGHLPYSDEGGPLAVVYRHVNEDATPIQSVAPGLAPELAQVTMRALHRSPADRYTSAEAFGVAVGEAMATVFGTDWMDRAELQLVDAGPIQASARQPSTRLAAGPTVVAPRRAGLAPGTRGGAATLDRAATVVRPRVADHRAGAPRAAPVSPSDLMPVQSVIDNGPVPAVRPVRQVALAGVLGFLSLGVAIAGLGQAGTPKPAWAPGAVTVAGIDPASSATVGLDLSRAVPIAIGAAVPGADRATKAQVRFEVAGLGAGSTSAGPLVPAGDGWATTVDSGIGRFFLAGRATAELRLLDEAGSVVASEQFAVRSRQAALLTFPVGLATGLVLFLAAAAETRVKRLRRGERVGRSRAGLALAGAGLGAVATVAAWALGGAEPSLGAAPLLAAVLGAGAGLSTGRLSTGRLSTGRLSTGRVVGTRPPA